MFHLLHCRILALAPAGLLALLVLTGTGSRAQVTGAPLPQVPPTPERLVATTAADAYREWVPGLLARQRLPAAQAGEFTLEVTDLIVGPGRRSAAVRWPGAALLEVRSGMATLLRHGERQPLRMGQFVVVDDEQSLAFDNSGQAEALLLRATSIGRGRR